MSPEKAAQFAQDDVDSQEKKKEEMTQELKRIKALQNERQLKQFRAQQLRSTLLGGQEAALLTVEQRVRLDSPYGRLHPWQSMQTGGSISTGRAQSAGMAGFRSSKLRSPQKPKSARPASYSRRRGKSAARSRDSKGERKRPQSCSPRVGRGGRSGQQSVLSKQLRNHEKGMQSRMANRKQKEPKKPKEDDKGDLCPETEEVNDEREEVEEEDLSSKEQGSKSLEDDEESKEIEEAISKGDVSRYALLQCHRANLFSCFHNLKRLLFTSQQEERRRNNMWLVQSPRPRIQLAPNTWRP